MSITDALRERLRRAYLRRQDADAERTRLEAIPSALRGPHELDRALWRDYAARRRLSRLVDDLRRSA